MMPCDQNTFHQFIPIAWETKARYKHAVNFMCQYCLRQYGSHEVHSRSSTLKDVYSKIQTDILSADLDLGE